MSLAVADPLVAKGLRCLTLEGSDLAADFLDDVRHPGEVGVDQGQFVEGLAPLALVFRDSSGFLEDCPPVEGVGGENLVDLPLNMANILVLPLIFGLGVDNGIHVVHRFRRDGSVDALLRSSTPRAVVISTLTTIGTFAALSLSPHRGTASVGLLLCFAVSFLLVFVLVVLPLLLAGRQTEAPALHPATAG